MSLMKFPDSILEKLTCSQCGSFLSTAPVGIYSDGQPICSSCSHQLNNICTSQRIARCYIYEEIASLYVFPCRYQSWGCQHFLPFNQTEEHESECTYHTYSCPVNIYSVCKWKGPVSLLYQHYESEHPESYLRDPAFEFKVDLDEERYLLIKIKDILLLLQTKCAVKENKIWFNVVYFGSTNNASLIKYGIMLNGADIKQVIALTSENPCAVTHMKLKPSKSLEVDINPLLAVLKHPKAIQCHWTIIIPEELKDKLNYLRKPDQKQCLYIKHDTIKCPYCRILMTAPIFRCPEGHITCVDCKGFENECKDCQISNVEFLRAYDLEQLAKSAQFYCRWRNCKKILNYDQIREHEWKCLNRLYRCPCCDTRIGVVPEVPKHFENKHLDIHFIYECCPSYSLNVNITNQDIHIFLQKEFIRIQVVRYNIGGHFYAKVVISHNISPRFCHYFKCEVRNNRKGLICRFDSISNPYVVTEHISKANCANGVAYFTIQLDINTWIPFDYPFKEVEIKSVAYEDRKGKIG